MRKIQFVVCRVIGAKEQNIEICTSCIACNNVINVFILLFPCFADIDVALDNDFALFQSKSTINMTKSPLSASSFST